MLLWLTLTVAYAALVNAQYAPYHILQQRNTDTPPWFYQEQFYPMPNPYNINKQLIEQPQQDFQVQAQALALSNLSPQYIYQIYMENHFKRLREEQERMRMARIGAGGGGQPGNNNPVYVTANWSKFWPRPMIQRFYYHYQQKRPIIPYQQRPAIPYQQRPAIPYQAPHIYNRFHYQYEQNRNKYPVPRYVGYFKARDEQQPGGSQVPPAPINAQSSASVFANHNRPPQSEAENKLRQFVHQIGLDRRPIRTQWTSSGLSSSSPMQPSISPKPSQPIILQKRIEVITAAPDIVPKFSGKAGARVGAGAGPSHSGHPVGTAGKAGKSNSNGHQAGKGLVGDTHIRPASKAAGSSPSPGGDGKKKKKLEPGETPVDFVHMTSTLLPPASTDEPYVPGMSGFPEFKAKARGIATFTDTNESIKPPIDGLSEMDEDLNKENENSKEEDSIDREYREQREQKKFSSSGIISPGESLHHSATVTANPFLPLPNEERRELEPMSSGSDKSVPSQIEGSIGKFGLRPPPLSQSAFGLGIERIQAK